MTASSAPMAAPGAVQPAPHPAVSAPAPGLLSVRVATPADDGFIEALHAIAFGPGRFARTAFRIRERFPIDPTLSLVSEVDGVPSGSVWMTPIRVGKIDGYLLGPLATHPQYRRRGAGKLLAREVTRRALARGEGRFVLLVGDYDYYGPLGWRPTTPGAIVFPGPVDYARVLAYSDEEGLATELAGPIGRFGGR